jgi:hypothetical protein
MFIQNVGQFDERARFQVRGGDRTIWLAEDAIWVTVLETSPHPPSPPSPLRFGEGKGDTGGRGEVQGVNLRLSFPGANASPGSGQRPHPRLEPFDRLDTVVSYFIGNDPAKWHVAVPVWGGVRYVDLYPGVDLEITGENGQMAPRLVAHPGADLSAVRLRVEGAEEVALLPAPVSGQGAGVRVATALGDFTLPLFQVEGWSAGPALVQQVDGLAFEVSHPFTARNEAVSGPSSVVRGLSSVVDPQQAVSLVYAGFLGGSRDEEGYDIAVDAFGNAYVTGWTQSGDFPAVAGPDLTYNGGYRDAFVAKVNAAGTGLVYAGFLGGSYDDRGRGIAVDSSGNAYVTGWTESGDFPAVAGPDTSFNGYHDAFVAKVGAGGGATYGVYLPLVLRNYQ